MMMDKQKLNILVYRTVSHVLFFLETEQFNIMCFAEITAWIGCAYFALGVICCSICVPPYTSKVMYTSKPMSVHYIYSGSRILNRGSVMSL